MKRGRLPLTALRSFEAAGRHGSFKAAAEELFVSPAAISRQIGQLEASLGTQLFERRHRAVVLTTEGRQLLSDVTGAFDSMAAALDGVAGNARQQSVIVSVEAAFASVWLGKHLSDFHRAHPDIEIMIDSDDHVIDFATHPAHLAIRYSRSNRSWPRCQARHLADVAMAPVISPALLATGPGLASAADILKYPLIHEDSRNTWATWFDLAGVDYTASPQGAVFTDHALILQSAARGTGVALADDILARDAVKAGELLRPFDLSAPFGAYWLVARNFDTLPRAARQFAEWLEARLGADLADAISP